VTCDVPAQLEIGLDRGGTRIASVAFPVAIRSLTCDGMGLHVHPPPGSALERGGHVTVRLDASGVPIALQGHVAWSAPFSDERDVNAGIHIDVEPIDSIEGRAWADWVVERITEDRSRATPRAVTAWLHELGADDESRRST
jgi:hypothetical protein